MQASCYECGSMVGIVREKDNKLYYTPHYVPGGADSRGFCPNISAVPDQILRLSLNKITIQKKED